jgi:hypothetical protein
VGDRHFQRAEPRDGMLSVDFGLEAGRAFWASEVLNATNSGEQLFDGVFADRAGSNPSKLAQKDVAAFEAGHQKLMIDVQDSIKGGGILIANNAYIPGVKATMLEGFQANQMNIEQLMQGVALNVSVVVHAGYGGGCSDAKRVHTLAAFLIGAGRGCVYACSEAWTFSTGWNQWYGARV